MEQKNNGYTPLSKEEYIEKRKAERNAVFDMIESATSEVASDPDKYRAYLDTQSHMDRYTVNNVLLIFKQRPGAVQLKEFSDWDESNVRVNKGEKSILILEPEEYTKSDGTQGVGYNVKRVFDVSQTNARFMPRMYNNSPRDLAAVMLDTSPVKVEAADKLPENAKGAYYDNGAQTLYVERNVGDGAALCQSIARELAYAHFFADGKTHSRDNMQFAAQSASYMFCRRFGVDASGIQIDKLPDKWQSLEPKKIRTEMSAAKNAFREISGRVSTEFYRRRQERAKGAER